MNIERNQDLTYERVAEVFRCDAETGVLERKLKSGRWRACGGKPNHSSGYSHLKIDGKNYLAHRLIWLLTHGEWPENEIDHVDRDRMNNKIENLRDATRTENSHNCTMNKNNSIGYPGVSFHKQHKKYRARIKVNYKNIFFGCVEIAEEAFTAYMLAKIEHHPTSPDAQEYLCELTMVG